MILRPEEALKRPGILYQTDRELPRVVFPRQIVRFLIYLRKPEAGMDEQELTDFVIREIGRHRRHSDVVAEVCERAGMEWREAQKFVYQVAYDHRKRVAARQSPLVLIIGGAFVVGGLGLALGGAVVTIRGVNLYYEGIPYVGNVLGVGLGILLVAGGALGLWEEIKKFL